MKCPVCNTDGISDTEKTCPHCQSDLEAFHLTGSIKKSFHQRLYVGIIASVLFVFILLAWAVTGLSTENNEANDLLSKSATKTLSNEQQLIEQENATLKSENEELKKQVDNLLKKQKKREKTYEVQYGESLFSIARKVYGNGYRFEDLARENNITDPNHLKEGQKIIIYY